MSSDWTWLKLSRVMGRTDPPSGQWPLPLCPSPTDPGSAAQVTEDWAALAFPCGLHSPDHFHTPVNTEFLNSEFPRANAHKQGSASSWPWGPASYARLYTSLPEWLGRRPVLIACGHSVHSSIPSQEQPCHHGPPTHPPAPRDLHRQHSTLHVDFVPCDPPWVWPWLFD